MTQKSFPYFETWFKGKLQEPPRKDSFLINQPTGFQKHQVVLVISIKSLPFNRFGWFNPSICCEQTSIFGGCTVLQCSTMFYTFLHLSTMYTHTHIHTCMHAYMRTCIHAYMHTCIHAHMHMHTHTCIHTHIHTHTYTHIHTHIHTHTYIKYIQIYPIYMNIVHVYIIYHTNKKGGIDQKWIG